MRHLLCLTALLCVVGAADAHHFAGFRAGFYGGHNFAAQSFYGYSALVVPSVPLVPVVAAPVVAAPAVAPVVQPVAAAPVVQPVAAVATPSYAYGAVSAVAVAPVVVRHRVFLGHRAAVVAVRAPVVVRRPAVVVRTRAVRVRH